MYNAKIICDSISETGKRLTTFEITFPRIVLAEFNTHRMLSRNSASSRAVPLNKQLKKIEENPFIPEVFPINAKGMQPEKYLKSGDLGYNECKQIWLDARHNAIGSAIKLGQYNDVHKQIANRLLEPFMWHTVIVTATEWDNFFKLRCDENAQYEIRRIADLMYDEYYGLKSYAEQRRRPKELKVNEWHLPFISGEDEIQICNYLQSYEKSEAFIDLLKKISVARCARVSYLTHDGKRDIEKDLELFERLRTSGHWSPFEHIATPYFDDAGAMFTGSVDEPESHIFNKLQDNYRYMNIRSGNFIGWKQYRKEFKDENCTYFHK
jgi:thymidylate synthase ThyX